MLVPQSVTRQLQFMALCVRVGWWLIPCVRRTFMWLLSVLKRKAGAQSSSGCVRDAKKTLVLKVLHVQTVNPWTVAVPIYACPRVCLTVLRPVLDGCLMSRQSPPYYPSIRQPLYFLL